MNKVIGGAGDLINAKPADYKDNLYLAVNGAWQETATIPPDKSRTGGFTDLDEGVEKTLMKDFHEFANNEEEVDDPRLLQAVKLYRLVNNVDHLSKFHQQPILKDMQRITDLSNVKDLGDNLAQLSKDGFALPIDISIDADMKDTAKNVVYIDGAGLILPDKTYYDEKNESGKQLLAKYADVAGRLLSMIGYKLDEAKEIVEKALKFDKSLVPIVKSSEEWADYTKVYNPMKFDEFITKSDVLDLKSLVVDSVNDTPEKVIVTEPRYLDNLNKLVNADTFEDIKAWMMVKFLTGNASILDEEFRQVIGEYNLALSGAKELKNRTKYAYNFAASIFSEVVGVYYGKKYFGEKAKEDVRSMVKKMIAVYEQRLSENTWLSEDTKKKAIIKLDKIVIKVGYPDKIDDLYNKFEINENDSLYDNVSRIRKTIAQHNLDQYHEPVDRTKWLMPGHMVNACYDPSRNDITFPAAILQAPFYSLDQTSSQNFGGIGAVIAHEISHAFDNNGAQFDEYGNMNNWWTDEDYAKFKKLTQSMIDEFEGIPYAGHKVNGKLVVSENVADVGGLRCALEAAKSESDFDVKAFFINWARVWRNKSTQQLTEMFLSIDFHAPAPLRANVQAQNMDEFYDAFDVTEKDGMWIDKDKRVNIW
ncbi:neutral endopeptidase [Companilactobacillus paralimentarius DSM 13238 = JCM 10415]|uniref:Neutral endopeptidase n=1 Tax=Companilactobacillus paralimentarius DSM 13238 = JCM 10415 TaxID=1122151 RepID=A0A0R1PCA9_9LACO|nr:M13-type metalloendopeptidase [Companilactobacillus paralimentarius]KAE9563496.1 peptidase M13 [Companilactobacillus paralimentarius]KRL29951.1 neutral endopeptidase [Companilactobacillus paralimentarius DSM 13238 = JCM 10415]QFR69056.1 M13 family peptidase [Companilactobacillus paralimentarius]